MPRMGFAPSRPPKPAQFEPMPSDQAVRIIDWTARLASETAKSVSSMHTTTANGACAMYGPECAIPPSLRSVSRSSTAMKCQGWRLAALGESQAASTMRSAEVGREGLFGELADGEDGADGFEDFHWGLLLGIRIRQAEEVKGQR